MSEKKAALPRRGLPVTGFGWTMIKFTARFRLPSYAFSRISAGRRPFPAIILFFSIKKVSNLVKPQGKEKE